MTPTLRDIASRAEEKTLWDIGKSCGPFCGDTWIWPPITRLDPLPFARLRTTMISAARAAASQSEAHLEPKAEPVIKPTPVAHVLDPRMTI